MRLIAIDPGPTKSGWVILVNGRPESFGTDTNDDVRRMLRAPLAVSTVVLEKVVSYGMAVGESVFETVFWTGRFAEAAQPISVVRLDKMAVRMHLCHDSRAKDPNIRRALMDRFGGDDSIRKGGPLYKVATHIWSALGIGVTYADDPAKATE